MNENPQNRTRTREGEFFQYDLIRVRVVRIRLCCCRGVTFSLFEIRNLEFDFLSEIFLANREEERLVSFGRERREVEW